MHPCNILEWSDILGLWNLYSEDAFVRVAKYQAVQLEQWSRLRHAVCGIEREVGSL
jgi:hypothetical protein